MTRWFQKAWQGAPFPFDSLSFPPLEGAPTILPLLALSLIRNCEPKALGADGWEVDRALLPCTGQRWAEMCNIVMFLKLHGSLRILLQCRLWFRNSEMPPEMLYSNKLPVDIMQQLHVLRNKALEYIKHRKLD